MMNTIQAGFVQLAPALGDTEATMERLEALADQFAAADLVVLPELCNSGYNFESPEQAWELSETVADSVFLTFVRDLCAKNNQHIVTGFCERDGDRLYNSSALVGPNGSVGIYRKLHLFMNEKDIFEPGDVGLPVFEIGELKVGMLICFDWVFPEAWRILALRGADIICHPSNLVIPEKAQRAVPIHAMINGVYVATANRIGTERELTFTGGSLIAGPRSQVLAQAPANSEAIEIVNIDIAAARNKAVTARNDLLADRRPQEYDFILEDQVRESTTQCK